MLNLEMIDNLYASLPKEKQQVLITLLFKKSKQTMAYFHRTKDISLSKLEILADFFGLPLDAFRKDGKIKTNNVSGNNNYVGNVSLSNNLMVENQALHKEVNSLEEIIKAKNQALDAVERMNKMLLAQVNNSVKRDSDASQEDKD